LASGRAAGAVLGIETGGVRAELALVARGRVLAEGRYDSVSSDPRVREAYLGVGDA